MTTPEEAARLLSEISPDLNTPENRAFLLSGEHDYKLRAFRTLRNVGLADAANCNFLIRYFEWAERTGERGGPDLSTLYAADRLRDCTSAGVLTGPVRDFLITQDAHFMGITSCLLQLRGNDLLTDARRDVLFTNPALADRFSEVLGHLGLVNELTEDNCRAVFANMVNIGGLARAYITLRENNKLTSDNCLALLADTANAETIANRLAHPSLPQLFFDRVRFASRYVMDRLIAPRPVPPRIAFMSARDLAALPGQEDVLRAAQKPADFYRPITSEGVGFDTVVHAGTDAHSGPELRKMRYLFVCLERENVIPRDPSSISETISSLVAFANRLDITTLSDSAVKEVSTKRMFKIGVDKCLRHNQRVMTGYPYSSRELILGLYNLIRKKEANGSLTTEELRELKSQFVMGVRQTIEGQSQAIEGPCKDPFCLTAAYKGFFPRDPEAMDTTGIFPLCHGRLKNISSSTAVVLGYPRTLGDELLYVLRELNVEGRSALYEKLGQADICKPETLNFTGSSDDTILYNQGVNSAIFANLFQLVSGGSPDDVSPTAAAEIRSLIEEINLQFVDRKEVKPE